MERRRATKLLSIIRQLEERRQNDLAQAERRTQLCKEQRQELLDSHARLSKASLGFMTNVGARLIANASQQLLHSGDVANLQAELRRLALVSKGVIRELGEALQREDDRELADVLEEWSARAALLRN